MAHSMTLPTLAALTLVGAGLGVHFGRASISEINPVFYNADEEYFSFASLSPNRSRSYERSHPDDFWASELSVSRDSYCPGCKDDREMPADRSYAVASYSPVYEDVAPEPVEYVAAEIDPAHEQVARYASFQVASDPAAEATETAEAQVPAAAEQAVADSF
jgi:hypothetical protein